MAGRLAGCRFPPRWRALSPLRWAASPFHAGFQLGAWCGWGRRGEPSARFATPQRCGSVKYLVRNAARETRKRRQVAIANSVNYIVPAMEYRNRFRRAHITLSDQPSHSCILRQPPAASLRPPHPSVLCPDAVFSFGRSPTCLLLFSLVRTSHKLPDSSCHPIVSRQLPFVAAIVPTSRKSATRRPWNRRWLRISWSVLRGSPPVLPTSRAREPSSSRGSRTSIASGGAQSDLWPSHR